MQTRPWEIKYYKGSFLLILTAVIILWASTIYAPSAPDDFDRATHPLEVLRYVQKRDTVGIRKPGEGTRGLANEALLTTLLLEVETWHPLDGGVSEDLVGDYEVLLNETRDYGLLYFKAEPKQVAVFYGGRYRMFRLPEPAIDQIENFYDQSDSLIADEGIKEPLVLDYPLPEPLRPIGTLADGTRVFYRPDSEPWPLDAPLLPIPGDSEDLPIGLGVIAIVRPEGQWQLLSVGIPSEPVINPDKTALAWIDNVAWEVIGRAWVYHLDHPNQVKMVTPLTPEFNPSSDQSVKQVLWEDPEHLWLIWGYGYGTVSQGGDLYRVAVANLSAQRHFKSLASEREEIISISRVHGKWMGRFIRWVDDNFIAYYYYEKEIAQY